MKKLNFLALYQLKYEDDYGEKPSETLMGIIASKLPNEINVNDDIWNWEMRVIICTHLVKCAKIRMKEALEACKIFELVISYYRGSDGDDWSYPGVSHKLELKW